MSTPNPTHIIAVHWYMFIPVAGVASIECDCGKFRTAGPYSIDEMRELHAAHVVSKLTDAGYSIMKREALARAMYLDQARRHVHPADELSPGKMWDGNFFSRKALWLAEADRILAAAAEGERP